jgi:molybdopterin-biosynthesis enzyme MoeA-like protein
MAATFGLFIVGDEILSGKRLDKHLAKVIELLASRGLALRWAQYLSDDRADITAALTRTFGGEDIVFSTGGIGATPDDHTRQAAAAALGVGIELHPEAERLISERIAEMNQGRLTDAENRQRMKMGEFPAGSAIIPNPYNKIPGFSIRQHYFVPGFPVMAWPMLEWVLDSHFPELFHRKHQAERSMLVFGSAESTLTPLMEQIESRFTGIKVFSLPSVGEDGGTGKRSRRHIELGVKGEQDAIRAAYDALRAGVLSLGAEFDEEP